VDTAKGNSTSLFRVCARFAVFLPEEYATDGRERDECAPHDEVSAAFVPFGSFCSFAQGTKK